MALDRWAMKIKEGNQPADAEELIATAPLRRRTDQLIAALPQLGGTFSPTPAPMVRSTLAFQSLSARRGGFQSSQLNK